MSRRAWGEPEGIPEGSDFTLEAVLTVNGALDTALVSSGGTFTLTISDSVLNGGVALLSDEAADSVTTDLGLVKWHITSSQSSAWEAGSYNGDIKLEDTAGTVTYWPVSLKVRSVRD